MAQRIWAFIIVGIVVLGVLAFVLEKRRPKAVAPQGADNFAIEQNSEGDLEVVPKFGSSPLGVSQ